MGKIADFFREQSIPLAQQQRARVISLDEECEATKTERDTLRTENLKLRAEVNPLRREVERLRNQLENNAAPIHQLEHTEIGMMKFIGDKRSITSGDIQTGMSIHSVPVEHYLGRLSKAGYIEAQHVPMVGAMYSLTDKGNAYLVHNKLVPMPSQPSEQPNNPKGHVCDHCGNTRLRRIGSRPDPVFKAVGVKQALYKCLDCSKESAFTNDE
jgi:DNA-binding MarR family transcriptional regulator/DNA-directed RNA polymerase subunit RPC12/RpoP